MNVYATPHYQAHRRTYDFLFDEKYRAQRPETVAKLSEEYSIQTNYYGIAEPGRYAIHVSRHQLLNAAEETVFTWDNINDDAEFCTLFSHMNGRHYLVFREDLYGYSVLELESGRTLRYIPEESFPLAGERFQETFIWTGSRYDPGSNLLAVSGCYWACPIGTLFLDFTEPLTEQSCNQWLDIHDVVDADYERYDDIDLERFGSDGLLYFKAFSAKDGQRADFTFSLSRTVELVQAKRRK